MDNKTLVFEFFTEALLALLIIVFLAPNILSFNMDISVANMKIDFGGIQQLPQTSIFIVLAALMFMFIIVVLFSMEIIGKKSGKKVNKKRANSRVVSSKSY